MKIINIQVKRIINFSFLSVWLFSEPQNITNETFTIAFVPLHFLCVSNYKWMREQKKKKPINTRSSSSVTERILISFLTASLTIQRKNKISGMWNKNSVHCEYRMQWDEKRQTNGNKLRIMKIKKRRRKRNEQLHCVNMWHLYDGF